MRSGRLLRIFLGGVIAALVAAGIYTYEMIREQQRSLENLARYDVAYTAHQAVAELLRFENALLRFDRQRTEASLDNAKLRFEILYSRASVLSEGRFRQFAEAYDSRESLVSALQEVIHRIDPVITDADTGLDVGPVLDVIQPFQSRLLGLAADANDDSARRDRQGQLELSLMHQWFSGLTFGLIVCGLSLVGILSWNNRLLSRAHRKLSRTTRDLEQTAADLSAANEAVAAANSELRKQNNRLIEKEDALRSQNVLFDAALNNMSQGLCMFDDELRPLVHNARFEQLFGLRDMASPSGAEGECASLEDRAPELAQALAANVRRHQAAEFELEQDDGRIIALAQQPMEDGGWVATCADVTEQRRAQARIAHMARHDGLTSLPNRYAFRERSRRRSMQAAPTARCSPSCASTSTTSRK